MTKKRRTAAESRYIGSVKVLDCVACGRGPSDAHHVFHDRYSQKKASDWAIIPLCKDCHQTQPYSVHRDKSGWRSLHGPDWSYIPETLQAIYGDQYSIDH